MNTMSIEHFYDFYFLEAMRAGISMAKSATPEIEFKHSFERLENDVNKTFNELTRKMAERIRLYLWAASLGEARHAPDRCKYAIKQIEGGSRRSVFVNANDYPMTPENIQTVKEVFDQNWGGAYGGKAWLNIVEAIEMYGVVSDATFIDHSIDLEHNGGNVFTKTEAHYAPVNLDVSELHHVRKFLDVKFAKDVLTYYDGSRLFGVNVTNKTHILLQRFSNIVSKVELDDINNSLEWLSEFDVKFGTEELTLYESNGGLECAICGDKIDEDDCEYNDNDEMICEYCYNEYYTSCDNCGKTVNDDNATEVDGEKLCEKCFNKSGAAGCDNCGEYHTEYIVTEDDSQCYCTDCKHHADYCEECGEWYSDIDEHNEDEHPEPEFEGYMDAEGVFVQEITYTIVYQWTKND